MPGRARRPGGQGARHRAGQSPACLGPAEWPPTMAFDRQVRRMNRRNYYATCRICDAPRRATCVLSSQVRNAIIREISDNDQEEERQKKEYCANLRSCCF